MNYKTCWYCEHKVNEGHNISGTPFHCEYPEIEYNTLDFMDGEELCQKYEANEAAITWHKTESRDALKAENAALKEQVAQQRILYAPIIEDCGKQIAAQAQVEVLREALGTVAEFDITEHYRIRGIAWQALSATPSDSLREQTEQLDAAQAQVEVLREALQILKDSYVRLVQAIDEHDQNDPEEKLYEVTKAIEALAITPSDCLREHDAKVIAEFRASCEGFELVPVVTPPGEKPDYE
jgi:hypothetical protein